METSPRLADVRVDVSGSSDTSKRVARLPSLGGTRPQVLEYKKGWFWAVALPTVIIVAVVVPLAVTVVNLKEQLQLAERAAHRGTASLSAAAAAVGAQYATAAECKGVIPKEAAQVGTPPPPLQLKGAKLVDAVNGTDVMLHGINWFGFNNGKTMVDGLDAGNGTWLAADFATSVYRLKLLGFNAVRLPFKFTDLESPTIEYARSCTPDNPLTAQQIANATLPPDRAKEFANKMPKGLDFLFPMNSVAGTCNAYLPNGPTTLPRFLWVVEYLVANGMYVLVDYHPHEYEMMYLADPGIFASKWRALWSAFTCLPNFGSALKGRVFLDLLNEPDEYGMGWSGGKTREYRPLGDYLIAAMDAINEVTPGDAVFFIQGGGQASLGAPWGDGFATEGWVLQQYGLEDPNPFFTQLISKPYRKQVVLSPHFYGESITNNTWTNHQLWEAASRSWGKLMVDNGYCVPGGECQRFPVVISEIGSKLESQLDQQQLADMAAYFNMTPPTDNRGTYPHEPVSGWFWFCWNANSEDTGGLVRDDWQTLQQQKIDWLVDHLNLQPWWTRPTLDIPKQQEETMQEEQLLPKPMYSSKRAPRNPDASLRAAHLLSREPTVPSTR